MIERHRAYNDEFRLEQAVALGDEVVTDTAVAAVALIVIAVARSIAIKVIVMAYFLVILAYAEGGILKVHQHHGNTRRTLGG